MVIGDFNKDGLPDIIVEESDFFSNKKQIFILINIGDFNFTKKIIHEPLNWSYNSKTGDIDSDGDLDFVFTSYGAISIGINDGKGIFTIKTKRFIDLIDGIYFELVDYDGDKDLDIIIDSSSKNFTTYPKDIHFIENRNNFEEMSLSTPILRNIENIRSIIAYDFNSDLNIDFIIARETKESMIVDYYQSTSKSSFLSKKEILNLKNGGMVNQDYTIQVRNGFNIVDFNKDGKMDYTVTSGFDKKQYVVLDTTLTDLKTTQFEHYLDFFPNPANEFLHIKSQDLVSIKILDINGKIINTNTSEVNKVDISELNSGIYFLQALTNKGGHVYSKFVKAR